MVLVSFHMTDLYIAGLSQAEAWACKLIAVSSAVLCMLKADLAVAAAKFITQLVQDLELGTFCCKYEAPEQKAA